MKFPPTPGAMWPKSLDSARYYQTAFNVEKPLLNFAVFGSEQADGSDRLPSRPEVDRDRPDRTAANPSSAGSTASCLRRGGRAA
jgi:hypothetical protein